MPLAGCEILRRLDLSAGAICGIEKVVWNSKGMGIEDRGWRERRKRRRREKEVGGERGERENEER